MKITIARLPKHMHAQVRAAYPEHSWTFRHAFIAWGLRAVRRLGLVIRPLEHLALWVEQTSVESMADARHAGYDLVLKEGILNPVMSPETAPEIGVSSFILQSSNACPSRKDMITREQITEKTVGPDSSIHSTPSEGKIVFLTGENVSKRLCDALSPATVLNLSHSQIDVEHLIALHKRGVTVVSSLIDIAGELERANSVITHDYVIALVALRRGKHVLIPDAAFAQDLDLRNALEAGVARAAALLLADARFVDTKTLMLLEVEAVKGRIDAMLVPQVPDAASKPDGPEMPAYLASNANQWGSHADIALLVGHPAAELPHAAALFGTPNMLQAPRTLNVSTLINSPETFEGVDLVVWHHKPSMAWVQHATGGVRMLSRAPVGMPMHLGRDKGFWPVLLCERLCGQMDANSAFGVHFDLAADLDVLDSAAQKQLRTQGRQMRPDLMRLQSTWRAQRHNLFVMTRKLGLPKRPRLVVLGRAAPRSGLPVQTNPDETDDAAVIMQLLGTSPETEIIYQPHGTVAADKTMLADIAALSDRVTLIEAAYDVAELALVVDGFHTVDSPFGLNALLHDKPVTVYGRPSYGGLGLTHDLDAQGHARPLLVAQAVDLDLFVGWYFTHCAIFVDPMTGVRVPAAEYAATWFPGRGEMTDTVATRLVARAHAAASPEFRNVTLQLLQAHVKMDHVRMFLDQLDMNHEVKTRPGFSLGFAEAHADLGEWRVALGIAIDVLGAHMDPKIHTMVYNTVPRIRARLHSTDDRTLFGSNLVTLLDGVKPADTEQIARSLMTKRYFSSALALLQLLKPTPAVLTAVCQCQIGLSDIAAAHKTLRTLVAQGAKAVQVEDFELALAEATSDWIRVADVLAVRHSAAPEDLNLMLRYARACAQAGRYDTAAACFATLENTEKSAAALINRIELEIARMDSPAARMLLETALAQKRPTAKTYSLLGDCLSFENALEGACEAYFSALLLDALDTQSYTRMCALERELEEEGSAPDILWSMRYKAHIAQVRDDTVETLLGEGRLGLLENDIDTMRKNAARAIALFPNDMRPYAWLGHAITWTPGRTSPQEVHDVIASYRASIAAGAEDGWWTTYDCMRSLAYLGQTGEIRKLLEEQYQTLFVGQKVRTGWPRFMAGAALSDLSLAFGGLRDYPRTALLRKHARNFRVVDSIDEIRPDEKVLFLSEGGVGDEIRYGTVYPELAARFPDAVFSVDERLASLYKRSFPQVAEFIPLPRFHRKRMSRDLLPLVGDLPDQALAQYFDNTLWAVAQEVDVVLPVPSVMADLRPDVAAFETQPPPRLIPDPALVAAWRKQMEPYKDTLLVGVIGTSRILEYQRVANYFTADELGEMYRLPNVTFVSLEYRDDNALSAEIRDSFGAHYLCFPDLDKMDDFDGVLALAHALDCVVGVNTATIELTGFGGVDTLFAAPNANHIWRDPHGTGQDLFFDTMQVVLSRDPSEKPLLTARIAAILAQRRDAKNIKKKAVS